MIRDPHAHTLVRTSASRVAPGPSVRCAWCGKHIVDPARVGSDPAALADLRHGDVVLDDTVYVVRGPDGERSLCLHCAAQSGITRGTTGGQLTDQPPRHPVVLLWGRRWSLLALFGGLLIVLVVFEILVVDVGTEEGTPWDLPILQAVRGIAALGHGPLSQAIAALGDLDGTIPLCALAVLALSLRRRWRDALYIGMAYGGALAANLAVNALFSTVNQGWGAPGPGPAGAYLSPAAMGSLALLAALTVLAWPTRWRWPTLALAAPLVVLVGVVRVALGADDPSDVLGGWAGSLVWTIGVSLTLTPPRRPGTPATGTSDG
jgi:membrane-associated phospholipid phosphatase